MTERRRDHGASAVALARAIHAAIDAYNRRHPHNPYPIDDATSRILENDPDYHPPRKRVENKARKPTLNPGIFTVTPIAEALETTLDELIAGRRSDRVLKSDLRTFRWIADYLSMRFPLDDVHPLPDDAPFIEKELSRPHPLRTTPLEEKGQVAAGQAPVESELEFVETEIVGKLDPTHMIAAQVRGRSMHDRIRDGDTVVIDIHERPRQGDPVAIYVEDEGAILGYWRAEAGAHYLEKHNPEVKTYKLGDPSGWHIIGVIKLVQSRVSRQDRPTR